MTNWNTEFLRDDKDKRVYNAFSDERFFDYDDARYATTGLCASLDKLAVIDEMISANITELTHRTRQE
jgi:hypothetical protein